MKYTQREEKRRGKKKKRENNKIKKKPNKPYPRRQAEESSHIFAYWWSPIVKINVIAHLVATAGYNPLSLSPLFFLALLKSLYTSGATLVDSSFRDTLSLWGTQIPLLMLMFAFWDLDLDLDLIPYIFYLLVPDLFASSLHHNLPLFCVIINEQSRLCLSKKVGEWQVF